MSSEKPISNKNFFKQWLEKLQQESWQLELLISGFALYGIYNSHSLILDYRISLINSAGSGQIQQILYFFQAVLMIGWRIFFINLLVHVILRALWIGAIGLRYVSNEIEYDQLGYNSYFENYLRDTVGSYDDFIENLEKICSVLFSFTFLLFLFFISIIVFLIIGSMPESIMRSSGLQDHWSEYIFMITTIVYYLCGLIVLIDFISLGGIRKINDATVTKLYAPIYKFVSYVTLSFLYRALLYNFLDNRYTKRLFFISFPYFLLLVVYPYLFESNLHPHLSSNQELLKEGLLVHKSKYADLLNESLLGKSESEANQIKYDARTNIVLSNYKLQPNYFSFFMRIYERDNQVLSEKYNIQNKYKEGWRFALFGNDMEEDTIKNNINEKYTNEYLSLKKEYNLFRNRIKQDIIESEKIEGLLSVKKDSIKLVVDSMDIQRTNELDNYNTNRNERILKILESLVEVSVDSIAYHEQMVCKYAYHEHFNERGLLCEVLNIELPKGHQIVEFKRAWYNSSKKDSLAWSTYKLPIIVLDKN